LIAERLTTPRWQNGQYILAGKHGTNDLLLSQAKGTQIEIIFKNGLEISIRHLKIYLLFAICKIRSKLTKSEKGKHEN
jgi:hypothetical protein